GHGRARALRWRTPKFIAVRAQPMPPRAVRRPPGRVPTAENGPRPRHHREAAMSPLLDQPPVLAPDAGRKARVLAGRCLAQIDQHFAQGPGAGYAVAPEIGRADDPFVGR